MRTTTKQSEGVAKKLRKLPAVADKPAPTPKKAVEKLQNELVSLVARGYSVAKIGQVLRGAGIEISAVTLRGYVRNANASNKRTADTDTTAPAKKKASARKAPARSTATGSTAASPASGSAKKAAPASKTRKPAPKTQATPSGGAHDHRNLQLAKASFVVRPDTPDSDL